MSIHSFGCNKYICKGEDMSFYPRIRDLREDNDLTQADVAKLLFITQQQYSLYERGYRDIPTALLVILADYYNTSTDYILGRTNKISPIN